MYKYNVTLTSFGTSQTLPQPITVQEIVLQFCIILRRPIVRKLGLNVLTNLFISSQKLQELQTETHKLIIGPAEIFCFNKNEPHCGRPYCRCRHLEHSLQDPGTTLCTPSDRIVQAWTLLPPSWGLLPRWHGTNKKDNFRDKTTGRSW